MNKIQLNTLDNKPISFVGNVVCEAEQSIEFSDGIHRQLTLKLYAIENGGFAPTIEYQSESPSERTGCVAEIVDEVKDIENFFYVFTPEELLEGLGGLAREDIDIRKRLVSALRKTFESLTFTLLDQVEDVVGTDASTPTPEKVNEPNSSEM